MPVSANGGFSSATMSTDFDVFGERLLADFNKLLATELSELQRRLLEHHELLLAAAEVAYNRKLNDAIESTRGKRSVVQISSPTTAWQGADRDSSPFILNFDEHASILSAIDIAIEDDLVPESQTDFNSTTFMNMQVQCPAPDTDNTELAVAQQLVKTILHDEVGHRETDESLDFESGPTIRVSDLNFGKVDSGGVNFDKANSGPTVRSSRWTEDGDFAVKSKRSTVFTRDSEGRSTFRSNADCLVTEMITEVPSDVFSSAEYHSLEEWQKPLVKTFFELDEDRSGSLSTEELRNALIAVGVPQARLQKLVRLADSDGDGDISFDEWIAAVKKCGKNSDIAQLSKRLQMRQGTRGLSFLGEKVDSRCMMRPHSPVRIFLDLMILFSCLYIASILPFAVAFDKSLSKHALRILENCDRAINYLFIFDIFLNFRTGYYDKTGSLIMDPRKSSTKYLKTWFCFDAASSFPFEDVTGALPTDNLQVLKIMKLGKLLRMVKLMKLQASGFETLSHVLDDAVHSKIGRLLSRRYGIFLQMLLVCHWLASGMKIVDDGFLTSDPGMWSEYLGALYWAMQTLTTVGYGDLVASSNNERAYSIFAMVIGGAFYGYVIGAVTSMVSSGDLNASAYWDRIDLIESWLSYHKFPKEMKKSIRRFFESYMRQNTALNDADIWADLSPEMQRSVGEYLIPENVKNNPLFDGMDTGAVVQLQSILRKFIAPGGTVVTSVGEVGTAMYIIDSGVLEMKSERGIVTKLFPGQSFGEEVLLGFFEGYAYTVTVMENAQLEMILESELLTAFNLLPRQLQRMRQNALELNPSWEQHMALPGGPSINRRGREGGGDTHETRSLRTSMGHAPSNYSSTGLASLRHSEGNHNRSSVAFDTGHTRHSKAARLTQCHFHGGRMVKH